MKSLLLVPDGPAFFSASKRDSAAPWRSLQPYLEARDAATADDLARLADKYFIANNRSVGVVRPGEVPQ